MPQEDAESIALKALTWLAGNDELMPVFLGATGASADDLRSQAGDPAFLVSVLDFLAAEDDWIKEFCDAEGFPYDSVMRARQALPGGGDRHWT